MAYFYTILKYFQLLLQSHCDAFYKYLNPLGYKNNSTSNSVSKWNFQFCVPVITLIISFFIGNIGLVFWSKDFTNNKNLSLTLNYLTTHPCLMTHQAFPKEMWPQIDAVFTMVFIFSLVSYCTLIQSSYKIDRYYLKSKHSHLQEDILNIGNQTLSVKDSKRILSFHKNFYKHAFKLFLIFVVIIIGFCYVNVFFINAVFKVSFFEIIFWTLFYPLTVFYLAYTFCAIALFIVLICRLVQIRQKSLLKKFKKLTKKVTNKNEQLLKEESLNEISKKCKSRRRRSTVVDMSCHFWLLYKDFNCNLLYLCSHIEQTSAFWAPLLTTFFVIQILTQGYLVYIFLFIPTLPIVVKYLGIYLATLVFLLFFGMIQTCARVATLNEQLEKENGRFCSQISSKIIKSSSRLLVKVSL